MHSSLSAFDRVCGVSSYVQVCPLDFSTKRNCSQALGAELTLLPKWPFVGVFVAVTDTKLEMSQQLPWCPTSIPRLYDDSVTGSFQSPPFLMTLSTVLPVNSGKTHSVLKSAHTLQNPQTGAPILRTRSRRLLKLSCRFQVLCDSVLPTNSVPTASLTLSEVSR